MPLPSRLMPPVQPKRACPLCWLLAAGLLAACAYGYWTRPFIAVGVTLLAAALLSLTEAMRRKHLNRLLAARQGESLCTFARSFDRHLVDTWVLRAVYEELQRYIATERAPFPLRGSDRLVDDLRIDTEDLDDMLGPDIAERTGRPMDNSATNPYYGKVRTVGDLVAFFCAQPKRADTQVGDHAEGGRS